MSSFTGTKVDSAVGLIPSQHERYRSLPAISAGGWRPGAEELPEKHNPTEMIGVVRRDSLQLLAHLHDPRRSWMPRLAGDRCFELMAVSGDTRSLLRTPEKSLPQNKPRFRRRLFRVGESIGSMFGIRSRLAVDPIERKLLPEGQMPYLFVDGMRDLRPFAVCEGFVERFENMRRRRSHSVGD